MTALDDLTVDPLLVETADRLLGDVCTFEAVEQAEADGWAPAVWGALAESGFPWISVPSEAGGSDGTLVDAMAVLASVGAHAAPVPFAETGVLAGWLLSAAGLALPEGPATVVPTPLAVEGGRLLGQATVAWAQRADRVVALAEREGGWVVVALRPDQLGITPGRNLAGEPREQVTVDVALDDAEQADAPAGVDAGALALRGALSRVVLMAGAASAMSQLTVDYTNDRRQFGQAIARFQAVQLHLVTAAQQAVVLTMAGDLATRALVRGEAAFEIAAAKALADEVAVESTRAAHQAHGAMGMTREYPLHHLSRRLWAWRHEWGQGRTWRRRLGADVVAAGADALFPSITR